MTNKNSMEERFDEKLFEENGWFKELGNGDNNWTDVLAFLHQEITRAVAEREKEIVEGIEKLYQDEQPVDCIDGETPVETYGYEATHNQALKAVLSLITKTK